MFVGLAVLFGWVPGVLLSAQLFGFGREYQNRKQKLLDQFNELTNRGDLALGG
jgi:hypothetical protein